jgi:hypothetical protein
VVPAVPPLVPAVPVLSMHALFVQVWVGPQQAVPQGVLLPQSEVQALLRQT